MPKKKPSERINEIFERFMADERDDTRIDKVLMLAIIKYLDEQEET